MITVSPPTRSTVGPFQNNHICYIAGVFPATARPFIGYSMVTWHLTMKLFPAKCRERRPVQKLWRQTGNSSLLYPRNVDRCFAWSEVAWCCCWNLSACFNIFFCFVLLYNKSLNDWPLGEQWILFPSNLNVSLDFVLGNIEILGNKFHCSPRDQSLGVKYHIIDLEDDPHIGTILIHWKNLTQVHKNLRISISVITTKIEEIQ